MAQAVGMATAGHEHAGIGSVFCNHIGMHVFPLNRNNKQQKKQPYCSPNFRVCHFVFACVLSSSIGVLSIGIRADPRRRHVVEVSNQEEDR